MKILNQSIWIRISSRNHRIDFHSHRQRSEEIGWAITRPPDDRDSFCKYEGKKEQRTTANMGERRVGKKVGTEEAVQADSKSYLMLLVKDCQSLRRLRFHSLVISEWSSRLSLYVALRSARDQDKKVAQ